MTEKKITRKVISKAPAEEKVLKVKEAGRSKKVCFFCQNKVAPSYTDISTLRRFVTDRAKIMPKAKSSLCSKHQRFLSKQIKYTRHLALLPFTPKL